MWAGMINCESTLPGLMELTIPYNSPESLTIAHARKSTKRNYQVALYVIWSARATVLY